MMLNALVNLRYVFLIIFFLHGILYFVYPLELDNQGSWIKLIKFLSALLLLAFLLFINSLDFKRILLSVFILIFLTLLFLISNSFEMDSVFILFVFPLIISVLIFDKFKDKEKLFKISLIIYAVSTAFAIAEYFLFNGLFSRFGAGEFGYRISSIFLNPNNFGIFIVFLTIFILESFKNKMFKYLLILYSSFIILLTVSKTAIVLFFVYLFFRFFKLLLVPILLSGFTLIYYQYSVDYDLILASFLHRNEYNSVFFDIANSSLIFPFLEQYAYTDNIYLQLWGFFSILGLIIFLFLNFIFLYILILNKKYIQFLVLFLFLLSGFTINFLYLWPLAYLYWFFVFNAVFFKNKRSILNVRN